MKKIIILSILLITNISLSQTKIATTEDGRRVLLKENKTWEYIDAESKSQSITTEKKCELGKNLAEPKSKSSERLRKHIAIENDCELSDVKFMKITEERGNGMYSVCVKGTEMKYRMIGTAFLKADQDPFPKK